MTDADLIKTLRCGSVQAVGMACLGCGHESSCAENGCAILRAAADRLEELTREEHGNVNV